MLQKSKMTFNLKIKIPVLFACRRTQIQYFHQNQRLMQNVQQNATDYVTRARTAFNSGRTRSLKFRKKQLEKLYCMYENTQKEMVKVLYEDLRKPKQESYLTEINFLKNDVRNILYNFNAYTKPQYPTKPLVNFFDGVKLRNEPYGVVLIIGAWNYPLQLTLLPLAGALAAGNCIIIKPSEISQNVADYVMSTIPQYLDEECYQVYTGGVPETTELLKERFDYIFFTGSPMVGKIVHTAAAKHLTPTTLELGGKSPVYIDESADMNLTVKRVLWGKFLNAGQTCIAPDYVLCTKKVEEKFLCKAEKILKGFYGNDPQKSLHFSRIINDRNFERLVNLIKNANIAIGGTYDREDRYISPTIVIDVKANDPLMVDEIFGPILPIMNVGCSEEAIDFINEGEKPLALYVFSKKRKVIKAILDSTSSGGVTVNDTIMHAVCENLPFGGVGNSGMGAYHGRHSFDLFTHKKPVLSKDFGFLGEFFQKLRYPPYSEWKIRLSSFLMKKRRYIP